MLLLSSRNASLETSAGTQLGNPYKYSSMEASTSREDQQSNFMRCASTRIRSQSALLSRLLGMKHYSVWADQLGSDSFIKLLKQYLI